MRKRQTVRGIDILFTEGVDDFVSHCEHESEFAVIDDSGKLTDYYARTLCTDYYIKGRYAKILTDLLYDQDIDQHSQELDILFRAGLIDHANRLTSPGYLKAISTLNLKNQIDYLGLPFDEFEPIRHQQGKHRERYAQEAYSDYYEFVAYDEGRIFNFFKTCFIYAARRYLIGFGFDKDLLKTIFHQPREYGLAIQNGLLAGKPHNFYQRVGKKECLGDNELTQRLTRAVIKSLSYTIKNISIKNVLADAEKIDLRLTKNHQMTDCNPLHQALVHLGEEGLRKLMAALIEHPTPDNRGWPDLTAFNAGQYIAIEVKVKGKEKLSFSQIERLFWLKHYFPEHARNQRISHIPLIIR